MKKETILVLTVPVVLMTALIGIFIISEWRNGSVPPVESYIPVPKTPAVSSPNDLLLKLESQAGPPMERIGDYNGVINQQGIPVEPNENSRCIHGMPINWTCRLCPFNQRVLDENFQKTD